MIFSRGHEKRAAARRPFKLNGFFGGTSNRQLPGRCSARRVDAIDRELIAIEFDMQSDSFFAFASDVPDDSHGSKIQRRTRKAHLFAHAHIERSCYGSPGLA